MIENEKQHLFIIIDEQTLNSPFVKQYKLHLHLGIAILRKCHFLLK